MLLPDSDNRPWLFGAVSGADHLGAPVSLDVRFVVDTGAGFPVIPRHTADQMVWTYDAVYNHYALVTSPVRFTRDLTVEFDTAMRGRLAVHNLLVAIRGDDSNDHLLGMSALSAVDTHVCWDPGSGTGHVA